MSLGTVTTTLHSTAGTNYSWAPSITGMGAKSSLALLGREYIQSGPLETEIYIHCLRVCAFLSKNSSERPAQHDCQQMSLGTVTTTLHSTAVTNYKGQTELSPKREHGNEKQPSAAVLCTALQSTTRSVQTALNLRAGHQITRIAAKVLCTRQIFARFQQL